MTTMTINKHYLLGDRKRWNDPNRKTHAYRFAGEYYDHSNWKDKKEFDEWIIDVEEYTKAVAVIANRLDYNNLAKHRNDYVTTIIPHLDTFVQKWGIDMVPHDIRWSVGDFYKNFKISSPPKFPHTEPIYLHGCMDGVLEK